MTVPIAPNDRWPLDPISDKLANGHSDRVNDCTRECLALVVGTSLSGTRVMREPARLVTERGKLTTAIGDKGSELTSKANNDSTEWNSPGARRGGRAAHLYAVDPRGSAYAVTRIVDEAQRRRPHSRSRLGPCTMRVVSCRRVRKASRRASSLSRPFLCDRC